MNGLTLPIINYQINEAGDQGVHTVAISCPSSRNIDGMVHRTHGYGEAFFRILTGGGRKNLYQDFDRICRGGNMLQEAAAISAKEKPTSGRDTMRSYVGQSILDAISTHHWIPDLKSLFLIYCR